MKASRFISLLLLFPALIGCSSPTLHKPSFDSYGKEVSSDYYTLTLQKLEEKVDSKLFIKRSSSSSSYYAYGLRGITKFNIISSSKGITEDEYENRKITSYYQKNQGLTIDIRNKRFKASSLERRITEGNSEVVSEADRKSNIQSTQYGELVNNKFCVADIENRVYTEGFFYNDVDFGMYVLMNYFDLSSSTSYNVFSNSYPTLYYANSNSVTAVQTASTSGSFIELTMQIKYDGALKIRAKYIIKGSYSYQKTNIEAYVDATIKTTTESVDSLDYSDYTFKVR